MAVVVSKKVLKSAVGRNKIRRRMYEALRLNLDNIPKGVDYVFVVYSSDVMTMPFGEVEKMIDRLVEESRVCYNG